MLFDQVVLITIMFFHAVGVVLCSGAFVTYTCYLPMKNYYKAALCVLAIIFMVRILIYCVEEARNFVWI